MMSTMHQLVATKIDQSKKSLAIVMWMMIA
jgi:hypothetical protein